MRWQGEAQEANKTIYNTIWGCNIQDDAQKPEATNWKRRSRIETNGDKLYLKR